MSQRQKGIWTVIIYLKLLPKKKAIQDALESKEEIKGFYGDLTRSAEPITIGSRHPISLVKNQIIDIFQNF
jgi:phenylalanyl-tRNA synthetase alpha chain